MVCFLGSDQPITPNGESHDRNGPCFVHRDRHWPLLAFCNIGLDYFARRHVLTELGVAAGLFLTLGGTATGNLTAAISGALFSFTVGRVLAKRRRNLPRK